MELQSNATSITSQFHQVILTLFEFSFEEDPFELEENADICIMMILFVLLKNVGP